MKPRKSKPMKPATSHAELVEQMSTLSRTVTDLAMIVRAHADAQQSLVGAQETLASSQADLNRKVAEMLTVWESANGFWKTLKFFLSVCITVGGIVGAIVAAAAFIKGGLPAVQGK